MKGVIVFAVFIAAICTIFAFGASLVIDHWFLLLCIIAAGIGAYAFYKKQQQERNKV